MMRQHSRADEFFSGRFLEFHQNPNGVVEGSCVRHGMDRTGCAN